MTRWNRWMVRPLAAALLLAGCSSDPSAEEPPPTTSLAHGGTIHEGKGNDLVEVERDPDGDWVLAKVTADGGGLARIEVRIPLGQDGPTNGTAGELSTDPANDSTNDPAIESGVEAGLRPGGPETVLVDSFAPFEGTIAVMDPDVTHLEVVATGPWTMQFFSPEHVDEWDGGELSGSGAAVLRHVSGFPAATVDFAPTHGKFADSAPLRVTVVADETKVSDFKGPTTATFALPDAEQTIVMISADGPWTLKGATGSHQDRREAPAL